MTDHSDWKLFVEGLVFLAEWHRGGLRELALRPQMKSDKREGKRRMEEQQRVRLVTQREVNWSLHDQQRWLQPRKGLDWYIWWWVVGRKASLEWEKKDGIKNLTIFKVLIIYTVIFHSINPSDTDWPARVTVILDIWPAQTSAKANMNAAAEFDLTQLSVVKTLWNECIKLTTSNASFDKIMGLK